MERRLPTRRLVAGASSWRLKGPVAVALSVSCSLGSVAALARSAPAAAASYGQVTEFNIPTASAFPNGIAAAPDGNLWFAEGAVHKIGRITTAGKFKEFATTNNSFDVASGPDGSVWFSEGNKVGRITTSGTLTEFNLPDSTTAAGRITAGPDGNLWFYVQPQSSP